MFFDPQCKTAITPQPISVQAQLFLDATDRVERGWCQYTIENARGDVCIARAIRLSAQDLANSAGMAPYAGSLIADANEMLSQLTGVHSLGTWNDAPGRTKAEVVALLRKAAAL